VIELSFPFVFEQHMSLKLNGGAHAFFGR